MHRRRAAADAVAGPRRAAIMIWLPGRVPDDAMGDVNGGTSFDADHGAEPFAGFGRERDRVSPFTVTAGRHKRPSQPRTPG